jgi:hypothetical protein
MFCSHANDFLFLLGRTRSLIVPITYSRIQGKKNYQNVMNLGKNICCLLCLAAALWGCSKAEQAQVQKVDVDKGKIDACALLTSNEIKSVQGEPLSQATASSKVAGGFDITQCYFALPTPSNSISLTLTRKGDHIDGRDPAEFWQKTFHRTEGESKGEKQERGEEKENSVRPTVVPNVGDEAYWMGNGVNGALYALKGHCFVRIGVGGDGDEADKIAKSKRLAQMALEHL